MIKKIFFVAFALFSFAVTTAQTATKFYDEGIKLINDSRYKEAMVSFRKAIAIRPDYKEALYRAGWTSNELEKYSDALEFLQKAKTLWPSEPKVHLELGYAFSKLDKYSDALSCYQKCISLNDDVSLAYKYLGNLYYDDANYEEALKSLKLYIKYEPDTNDEDVYFRKAASENELELFDDALVSITTADSLKPNTPKFLNEMGYCYHKLNDDEQALKTYKKSLAIDPSNATANYWAGWIYNEKEDYKAAITYLKKAIETDDRYVSAYVELGYADYSLKNYDAALATFKKVMTIEKTQLALYYSGLCYIGKKDKTAATKMVKELKEINSGYADDLQDAIDEM